MEVSRTINGSTEQCYNLLMESLCMDIKASTGEALDQNEINEGFTYQKTLRSRMGNSGVVTVTVLELKQSARYRVRFESAQGTNELSYELIPVDKASFTLKYEESYHSHKKSKMLNFKLMERFYRKGSRKRINLLFDQIEGLLKEQI